MITSDNRVVWHDASNKSLSKRVKSYNKHLRRAFRLNRASVWSKANPANILFAMGIVTLAIGMGIAGTAIPELRQITAKRETVEVFVGWVVVFALAGFAALEIPLLWMRRQSSLNLTIAESALTKFPSHLWMRAKDPAWEALIRAVGEHPELEKQSLRFIAAIKPIREYLQKIGDVRDESTPDSHNKIAAAAQAATAAIHTACKQAQANTTNPPPAE